MEPEMCRGYNGTHEGRRCAEEMCGVRVLDQVGDICVGESAVRPSVGAGRVNRGRDGGPERLGHPQVLQFGCGSGGDQRGHRWESFPREDKAEEGFITIGPANRMSSIGILPPTSMFASKRSTSVRVDCWCRWVAPGRARCPARGRRRPAAARVAAACAPPLSHQAAARGSSARNYEIACTKLSMNPEASESDFPPNSVCTKDQNHRVISVGACAAKNANGRPSMDG